MAAVIGALRMELSASIAKWQSDLGKAADSLKGFSKGAKAIASDMESVGKKMSLAITAPLALLGKAALTEAKQARDAQLQVQAALASTGATSGKTAEGLAKTAKQLQNISVFDDDDILRNVTANLLTFGNVVGPVFDRAQKAIIDLASRLGGDLQGATIKVGRALNDPIQGVTALSRVGVQFTTQQKEQIKTLVQNGKGMEAQGIILDALTRKFGGAAEAMRAAQPDAQLTQAWRDFQETIGNIELKLLPGLVSGLKEMFGWFQALSPETQKWVVIVAGIATVVGPVLVAFSSLLTIIARIAPLILVTARALAPFVLVIGTTAAVVAGCAAAVYLLYEYWDALTDLLSGKFASAWEKAKTATKEISGLVGKVFGAVDKSKAGAADAATGAAGAAAGTFGGKGSPGGFDLHNEDQIKKTAAATETLGKQIDAVQLKINRGLDDLALPKSTASANALNAQLDEYVKAAKDAGVNTDTFARRIASLRDNIAKLEQAGLAKEAQAFSREVDKDTIAVKQFGAGGLAPLQDHLTQIDDQYDSLHDQIQKQIDDNKALADVNDSAKASMARLTDQLAALEEAHKNATASAKAQYFFEQQLADVQSKQDQANTQSQIEDLKAATGQGGPVGSAQADLQKANRDLVQTQSDAMGKLIQLEADRNAAAQEGFTEEVARKDKEIELQTKLLDLVDSTTGAQLVAAGKVNQAFDAFTDSLSDGLTNVLTDFDGSVQSITNSLKQLGQALFVKPFTDAASSGIGGFLKDALGSLAGKVGSSVGGGGSSSVGAPVQITSDIFGNFGGAHAGGGSIDPGKWGIVGEKGPEVAYGGSSGLDIFPNGKGPMGRGLTLIQNISTPDVGGFNRNHRQIAAQAKRGLGM